MKNTDCRHPFELMWHGWIRRVKSQRGSSLVIVLMIMFILLVLTGASLMFSGLDLRIVGNLKAGTQTFYAADTGVNVGLNQLSPSVLVASAPFSGTLPGGLAYRSGQRNDPGPQPLQLIAITTQPGYTLGTGTGYNTSGYVFHRYKMNVTGTGPMSTAREIEAIAEYGPVPQ